MFMQVEISLLDMLVFSNVEQLDILAGFVVWDVSRLVIYINFN